MEETFKKLASHMLKGIMIHESLIDYYDFLNFKGFKKIHEYHYFIESIKLRRLKDFYLSHAHKLIEEEFENPSVIPESWHKYTKFDVDNGTRQTYFKSGLEMWKKWEEETRELLVKSYKELMAEDEVLSARFVCDLMDHELEDINDMILDYKSVDYSMSYIESMQNSICDKYCCMMQGIQY